MDLKKQIAELEVKRNNLIKNVDKVHDELFKLKQLKEQTELNNLKEYIRKVLLISEDLKPNQYIIMVLSDVKFDKGTFKFINKEDTSILILNNFPNIVKFNNKKKYIEYNSIDELEFKTITFDKYFSLVDVANDIENNKKYYSDKINDI